MNKRHRYRKTITIDGHKVKKYFADDYPWAVEALKRDNFECKKCKRGGLFLIVHHLDESRKIGVKSMNNNLLNIITLCRSCHAKIHKITADYINPGRMEAIKKMRLEGMTLQDIGYKFDLSRERVRQICNYGESQKIPWYEIRHNLI